MKPPRNWTNWMQLFKIFKIKFVVCGLSIIRKFLWVFVGRNWNGFVKNEIKVYLSLWTFDPIFAMNILWIPRRKSNFFKLKNAPFGTCLFTFNHKLTDGPPEYSNFDWISFNFEKLRFSEKKNQFREITKKHRLKTHQSRAEFFNVNP